MLNIYKHRSSFLKRRISKNALKVLYRLNQFGFQAYLVGGWVRDVFLGIKPNDLDIVTNATPEKICILFQNSKIIGKRFQLVCIIFKEEIIEVSTFRKNQNSLAKKKNFLYLKNHHGILLKNNIFGSIEEDAKQRDFSINSIYYNAIDCTIKDYLGGLFDLRKKIIRIIGNPEVRYREDPVRILRAIRFAAKLNMKISYETSKPFSKLSILLQYISPFRLFDEYLKLFQSGYGQESFFLLKKYNLLQFIFPVIENDMEIKEKNQIINITIKALKKIDFKINSKKKINPAFLFSVILWYPLIRSLKYKTFEKSRCSKIFSKVTTNILNNQKRVLAIPKKIECLIKNIWKFQWNLNKFNELKCKKRDKNNKLAYDLLKLRYELENIKS